MNVKKFRIKLHIQFDLIVNIKIYNTHISVRVLGTKSRKLVL